MDKQSVSCVTFSRVQAEEAIKQLINAGFFFDRISVLLTCGPDVGTQDEDGMKALASTTRTAPDWWRMEGPLGWLSDLGWFCLPGAGRFMVAGPLNAALGGPTASLTPTIVRDGLARLGVSPRRSRWYQESVENGGIFLSLQAKATGEVETAREIFHSVGAVRITVSEEGCPSNDMPDDWWVSSSWGAGSMPSELAHAISRPAELTHAVHEGSASCCRQSR
jgi:hypothetical protein